MTDEADFLAEDYRYTADLLRQYSSGADVPGGTDVTALFRAVCANNLSIILAALDKVGVARIEPLRDALDEIVRHCGENGETGADRDGRWAAHVAREALRKV